jgi:hypothetical protein
MKSPRDLGKPLSRYTEKDGTGNGVGCFMPEVKIPRGTQIPIGTPTSKDGGSGESQFPSSAIWGEAADCRGSRHAGIRPISRY